MRSRSRRAPAVASSSRATASDAKKLARAGGALEAKADVVGRVFGEGMGR